jgi:hypothetical protein
MVFTETWNLSATSLIVKSICHSPDLLNAVTAESGYWRDTIKTAKENYPLGIQHLFPMNRHRGTLGVVKGTGREPLLWIRS